MRDLRRLETHWGLRVTPNATRQNLGHLRHRLVGCQGDLRVELSLPERTQSHHRNQGEFQVEYLAVTPLGDD